MKDRTRSYRTLVPTFLALIKPTFRRPCFTIPALGAAKPSRPTKRRDISQAVIVANKSLSKFNQCFWIVLHSHIYYMLWQVESSAYPRILFSDSFNIIPNFGFFKTFCVCLIITGRFHPEPHFRILLQLFIMKKNICN